MRALTTNPLQTEGFVVLGKLALPASLRNVIRSHCVFSALMLLSATMWWFDRDGKKPATEGIPPSSTAERVR